MSVGAVILLILKIIGIIIGSVIGLVLLLALAILFVPVRYRAAGDVDMPEFCVKATGSWLLHIVHASFTLENGTAFYLRVFGIPIKKTITVSDPDEEKDDRSPFEKILDKILPKRESTEEPGDEEEKTAPETPEAPAKPEPAKPEEAAGSREIVTEKTPEPEPEPEPEPAREKTSKEILDEILAEEEVCDKPKPAPASAKGVRRKKGIFKRIKNFFAGIVQKIKGVIGKIAEAYNKAHEKYDQVAGFFDNDDNMNAIKLIRDRLFILLRHIRPRKIKGKLILGLEDPATTGKIIGAYYMLFAPRKDFLDLRGEFYEEIIQGRVFIRGHIRVIHLLIAFIKLYKNKKIKSWIKKED